MRGTYSYVDANNVIQTVNYVSDALGYRVAATNLPVGPEPAAAPAIVAVEAKEEKEEEQPQQVLHAVQPVVNYVAPTYAIPYAPTYHYYAAQPAPATFVPQVVVAQQQQPAAPAVVEVKSDDQSLDIRGQGEPPVAEAQIVSVPIQSQYHMQDETGQYQFGYSDPNANRAETKSADGVVTGIQSLFIIESGSSFMLFRNLQLH